MFGKITSVRWLAGVLLAAGLLIFHGCGEAGLPRGAPIIIVDIDTLRPDHLGCYGYHRPTSPEIDAFSREAVLFQWAFSQAPNTGPSQASILTSLYPSVHGRIKWGEVIPEEVVTLAEELQEGGYATAAFVDGGMMAAEFGYTQGFEIYDDEAGGIDKIDPKARAWLRANKQGPFLLLIHSYDVHGPYEQTPEPFKSMFLTGLEIPDREFVTKMHHSLRLRNDSRFGKHPYSLTPVEVEYAKALYDGGIRHVDEWFGGFLDFLRQLDLYDRSIIVFISDHGDEFEEHDSVLHDRIYSPITHIPLLIRFPHGRFAREVAQTMESIDLMPTLLDAVGRPPALRAQGETLLPLIRGKGSLDQLAISESPFHGRQIALATADMRLIYTVSGDRAELYDYRRDPLEAEDLAGDHPETVARLRGGMERWRALVEPGRREASDVGTVKESTIEALRALGYLDERGRAVGDVFGTPD